jgi:hypothetical protein|tara:strand:- start:67 stop:504 length:438 start_codon:yes stop_codon:yes gene_type:complete
MDHKNRFSEYFSQSFNEKDNQGIPDFSDIPVNKRKDFLGDAFKKVLRKQELRKRAEGKYLEGESTELNGLGIENLGLGQETTTVDVAYIILFRADSCLAEEDYDGAKIQLNYLKKVNKGRYLEGAEYEDKSAILNSTLRLEAQVG